MDKVFGIVLYLVKLFGGEKLAERIKSWTWLPGLAMAIITFGNWMGWWTYTQDQFLQMLTAAGFVTGIGVADNVVAAKHRLIDEAKAASDPSKLLNLIEEAKKAAGADPPGTVTPK